MRLVIHKHLVIDKDRPLVFLDMDGVLNGGYPHEHYHTLYRDAVQIRPSQPGDYVLTHLSKPLMHLLKQHRAQIVLVSSWFRPMIDAAHDQVSEFNEMFGIMPLGSLETQGGTIRGQAVAGCLAETRHRRWLVIDDCTHFYTDDRLVCSRLITPNGRYGLETMDLESIELLLTA